MALPTGPSVTFLFTDIEGSTRLERAVGSARWAGMVARHDELVRAAIEAAGGVVVKTEGDAFFAAFDRPRAAAEAVVAAQRGIEAEPWPADAPIHVRMGLHTGEGRLRDGRAPGDPEDYVGIDVNYAARIAAAGNGRQIVASDAFVSSLGPEVESIADGVALTDEGLRAVKDFEDPARLHRLVVAGTADDARPLRTLDAPTNLPGELTSLVGRDAEIAAVGELLRNDRIVTLSGPGGSGKTRLALAVARSVRSRFPHGTWFVDLAAVRDPALLDVTIATAIGLHESNKAAIGPVLRAHLRDRTVLLVIDNLEQLLPAAADEVSDLLRSAPDVRVIVTSREVLRIAGERNYPVPPLDLDAGVVLFAERARAQRPDLAMTDVALVAIRQICERLGGLPLAIELAAARTRTMGPAQILERLGRSLDLTGRDRDLPERQRTLRGAITWSHDLLPDPERRLFRRLAVFAGGWTLAEAEAVVDVDGDLGLDVLGGLESLADKSLVRIEPTDPDAPPADQEARFGLHPLLREYAWERLDDSGELAALEARHAAVMTALAERLGADLLAAAAEASMRHLDHEAYNLRAAIDWSLAVDEPDLGLRIMGSTWRWYQQRGRLREGRWLLGELLSRPAGDVTIRLQALSADGGLAYWMDDVPAARQVYEERLALAETTGDPGLIADGHYDLGFVFMVAKDGPNLRLHEQLALDGYLAAGREVEASRARQAIVLSLFLAGDYAAARRHQEAALESYRLRNSPAEVADSQTLLSAILFRLDEPVLSWRTMTEALRFFDAGSLASGTARAMVLAAILQIAHGDAELGTRLAGATYELARDQGVMLAPITVLHLPDPKDLADERLGAERTAELLSTGAATPLAEVVAEVLATDAAMVSSVTTGASR